MRERERDLISFVLSWSKKIRTTINEDVGSQ